MLEILDNNKKSNFNNAKSPKSFFILFYNFRSPYKFCSI